MWLARRFTIICIIGALTGVALADLVQNGNRRAYSIKVQTTLPCIYETPNHCGPIR